MTIGRSTPPDQVVSPPPFNLNTISRGVSTADFYLAVPTAIVRFLESDTHTKIMAKPQLRGAEGAKLSYSVGDAGSDRVDHLHADCDGRSRRQSPQLVHLQEHRREHRDDTPRDARRRHRPRPHDRDSAVGPDKAVAGTTVRSSSTGPSPHACGSVTVSRTCWPGWCSRTTRTAIQGFPGAIHVPGFKQLLSGNTTSTDQTEIIMLLTPHIVRTTELTESDLRPGVHRIPAEPRRRGAASAHRANRRARRHAWRHARRPARPHRRTGDGPARARRRAGHCAAGLFASAGHSRRAGESAGRRACTRCSGAARASASSRAAARTQAQPHHRRTPHRLLPSRRLRRPASGPRRSSSRRQPRASAWAVDRTPSPC